MKTELVDLAVILKLETEKAYLVDGSGENVWLPKSQVEYYDDGKGGIVTMPYWLAYEKGLI